MNQEIVKLVNKLPDPDQRGFMSNIDKKVVDDVTVTVLKGGAESITAVIDMLVEPGKGDDYKAHYLLHCMVIRVGNRKRRRAQLAEIIAGCLDKDYAAGVKKYLIRELQLVGGAEVVGALEKCKSDNQLAEPARQALAAIQHTV
jgi:hypothetical protein